MQKIVRVASLDADADIDIDTDADADAECVSCVTSYVSLLDLLLGLVYSNPVSLAERMGDGWLISIGTSGRETAVVYVYSYLTSTSTRTD